MQQEQTPPATAAPPTDAQRLWAHYQKPRGSSWPKDRLPMQRWEWLRLIQRLELSAHVKAVAAALAAFCDGDGSNVVTTDAAVYHGLGISDRQLRTHVAVLHEWKLLYVAEHGGGRGRSRKHGGANRRELNENAIVCQLTEPADGALPYRLGGDYEPLRERPKGKAPTKAIEASRAGRAENSGSPTTAVTGTQARKQRKPGFRRNTETAEAPLPQDAGNSGSATTTVSGIDEANTGSWASGDGWVELANSGSPASTVPDAGAGNSGSGASDVSPVDNPTGAGDARKPGFRSSPETPEAALPKLWKPGFQNSGSPASAPVFKTLEHLENPTTRVVSLGGDLTSADPAEPTPIDPELPGPALADEPAPDTDPPADREPDGPGGPLDGETAEPDHDRGAVPVDWPTDPGPADPADVDGGAVFVDELTDPDPDAFDDDGAVVSAGPVPDREYAWALNVLNGLDQADIGERLSDAQGELELEAAAAAGSEDDGATVYADSRQIMIRAARIVLRAQSAAHHATQPGRPRIPPRPRFAPGPDPGSER